MPDDVAQRAPRRAPGVFRPRPEADSGEDADRPTVERAAQDRRRSTRMRAAAAARSQVEDPLRHLVPARWRLMAAFLTLAFGLVAFNTLSLPDLIGFVLATAAIAICAAAPFIVRYQDTFGPIWTRYVIMSAAITLPLILFGLALARWAAHGPASAWASSIAALVMMTFYAACILDGRIIPKIAATGGLWLGPCLYGGNPGAQSMMALWTAIAVVIAYQEARRLGRRAEARTAREHEQRRAEELLAEYEETGQGWFWETDRRGQLTYVSRRIAKLLGKDQAELEGRPFTDLFVLDRQEPGHEQESERTLVFHLSTRSSFHELQVRAATREEEERWWSISGRPVLDQFDNFLGFRGSGSDLTETRKSQRHVVQLARFDSLTKLANRFQMAEWLEKILSAPRVENKACAVFLLDLDRFKQVNDTMGHPAGDALLKQVADRLRSTVGEGGQVGRLGGDEFQVVLPGRIAREELAYLAHRIIENLSQPYSIEGSRVTIGASVGIALSPDDGTSSEALIRNADLALYAAKDGGRGRHHFYAQDLHSDAQERQQLEQDLRDAIAHGGLELYYQPQVRVTTEKITGFEALLRWKHPRQGYLSPAKFVPVAEEAGLIPQIGEWALRTACHDLSKWPEEVRVAVNVSPLQFANPALPAIVTSAIAAAGIAPGRLELEITESVFMGDDASTEAMFAALKGVGVRLALDDFGTGYSSLGYLQSAPFDKIKIDQSFVRGATMEGSRNGAIIAAIVSLAEALGMETTAEGVETLDELDLIRMLGCSHVQGYIYEKPLPPAAATERLARGLTAIAQGPRSARAPRQTMLRKVTLEHGGQEYAGTIRNISRSGALVEGLWNVPTGTTFEVQLSDSLRRRATCRWCSEDRMGVGFDEPLPVDASGAVSFTPPRPVREKAEAAGLRKAG
ncbi:diguanylate cyclase (GGDEF)-like protein/PAS domain S-box-containing protein [Novosphingobium chloroacetimidivorans]|uniref:Diguanylate cyclase (GGDEF)-like protein/PAS domain S-box-containing protein n=1 Tax=Novosphingobium chloroacetimidivorans TaxID=1428314 RepID=A0A7W7KCW7_9SPHN|nr:diguanylate cyclase (GGDEF)-like protein/PAS domain S-box-containing protein [Novosphingobium chloroacetimidivorans]